jgi:hypothetical protein
MGRMLGTGRVREARAGLPAENGGRGFVILARNLLLIQSV